MSEYTLKTGCTGLSLVCYWSYLRAYYLLKIKFKVIRVVSGKPMDTEFQYREAISPGEMNSLRASVGFRQIDPRQLEAGLRDSGGHGGA